MEFNTNAHSRNAHLICRSGKVALSKEGWALVFAISNYNQGRSITRRQPQRLVSHRFGDITSMYFHAFRTHDLAVQRCILLVAFRQGTSLFPFHIFVSCPGGCCVSPSWAHYMLL